MPLLRKNCELPTLRFLTSCPIHPHLRILPETLMKRLPPAPVAFRDRLPNGRTLDRISHDCPSPPQQRVDFDPHARASTSSPSRARDRQRIAAARPAETRASTARERGDAAPTAFGARASYGSRGIALLRRFPGRDVTTRDTEETGAEPPSRFELETYGLRNRCSTAELRWRKSKRRRLTTLLGPARQGELRPRVRRPPEARIPVGAKTMQSARIARSHRMHHARNARARRLVAKESSCAGAAKTPFARNEARKNRASPRARSTLRRAARHA